MPKSPSLKAIKIVLTAAALLGTSVFCLAQNNEAEVKSKIEKSNGLETVEFDTLTGTVEVNLPDDLSATDTISGTVVVEPKGETKEEIAQNEDTLRGYVVEIENTQEVQEPEPPKATPPVKKPPTTTPCTGSKPPATSKPPTCSPTIIKTPPCIYVVPGQIPNYTCQIPRGQGGITIVIRNSGGQTVCSQPVTCNPQPPRCPPVKIPTRGTCGKPLQIPGKCDGRVANSTITVNGTNCPVLAESPRQQICNIPANVRGQCTIERNECGQITRGTITMVPPAASNTTPSKPQAPPTKNENYVFRRTGPFVEQETPSCFVDQGNSVSVTNSSITWTGPKSIKGDPHVSATLVFQQPPEIIRVGDKFSLSASISGDQFVSTQAAYNPNYAWIKPGARARSVTLSEGYGEPSGTFEFFVENYLKMIDDALKQHPEMADKVTPEVKNKMPEIQLFCPGRVNVKIIWKYVREK